VLGAPDLELFEEFGVFSDKLVVELGELQALLLKAISVGNDVVVLGQNLLQIDIIDLLLVDLFLQTLNHMFEVLIFDFHRLAISLQLACDLSELTLDFLTGRHFPLLS
jgi:hypothetical protein